MAHSRPSGTVTFLFTDIEGSTKIAQQYPDTWIQLRERHDELMHAGIQPQDGFVFQIVGDQFCVAFHTAADAVLAATKIQRALERELWSPTPIKVRMGLHSGMAQTGPMDNRRGGLHRLQCPGEHATSHVHSPRWSDSPFQHHRRTSPR